MLGKIAEMFGGIPRMALVAIVLLALIGGVWFWKRRSAGRAAAPAVKAAAVDRETETVKAERAASQYADMIAKGLPERRDEDDAEIDSENAVTDEYVKSVGADQEMSASDEDDEDDEEYEPMDA